jgi:hypothetical protein
MMRDPKFWPGISAPHGEHVMKTFYDEGGPFRLGALPMGLFMNGHGYFVGASHARLQVQPLAVHATYSLDRHDGVAKRQRFREAGLWRSDPDEYFQGAYLALNASVSPRVQRAIDAFAAKRQSPNNVGVHATALQEYVAELRDALALARALRRTLVLPRWLCYCDRLWSPSDDIFHFGCMYPGAQDGKFLPFVCPMDHVLSPTDWEQAGQPYRDAAFLESSRLPAAAKASITDVAVLPRAAFDALPPASRQHALPSGVTDKEAVQLLRPLEGTAVLRLSHARGLLCGIDDATERSAFNSLASRLLRTPAWCAPRPVVGRRAAPRHRLRRLNHHPAPLSVAQGRQVLSTVQQRACAVADAGGDQRWRWLTRQLLLAELEAAARFQGRHVRS